MVDTGVLGPVPPFWAHTLVLQLLSLSVHSISLPGIALSWWEGRPAVRLLPHKSLGQCVADACDTEARLRALGSAAPSAQHNLAFLSSLRVYLPYKPPRRKDPPQSLFPGNPL